MGVAVANVCYVLMGVAVANVCYVLMGVAMANVCFILMSVVSIISHCTIFVNLIFIYTESEILEELS